ncbi:MAG: hypothetical protein J0I06_25395 [Planctomycetes bacterium]|nr:hypothetical protein [Planctomycetota bacterium]
MKTFLFALSALALVGCKEMGIRPVGPLAKNGPPAQNGQPLASPPPAAVVAARPPAIKPTPPTMLVTPGEVTPDNAQTLAQKLSTELSTDSKASANLPVTAEVSRYKGGVKQP